MFIQSINGNRYVLVVVDDYSRYTWVFFLHYKDEASEVIISFIKKTQVNLQLQVQHVQTDNGTKFKNKTLAKFFDEIYLWIIDSGCSKHMTGNRALFMNFVEKFLGTVRFGNNDFAVIAGYGDVVVGKIHQKHHKSKTTSASNKPLYLLHMDLCGPMHAQSINGKRYVLVVVNDYSRYTWVFFLHSKDDAFEVIISFIKKTQVNLQLQVQRVRIDNGTEFKNKTLAKFFDEDVYSKEYDAFRIYNKRTRKIYESVNVNFDEISEMASKQFSLEPGLSNLNETGKSSNPTVSQVLETSKKDLEDLFHKFYDEYFDSSKIMKSSTTNVETLINEEVFHEVSKSFQWESSSSSLNDDVQQSP
nr:ribonuclease H-like domain-containing protein [Tanacetum cinerariifolium]